MNSSKEGRKNLPNRYLEMTAIIGGHQHLPRAFLPSSGAESGSAQANIVQLQPWSFPGPILYSFISPTVECVGTNFNFYEEVRQQ